MKHCPFQSLFLSLSLSLSPSTSVTRFGKNLQLWKEFKSIGHFLRVKLSFAKIAKNPTLAKIYAPGQIFSVQSGKMFKKLSGHTALYLNTLSLSLSLSLSLKCSLLNSILTHTRMQTNTQSRREFDEIESINGEKMFLSSTITLIFEAWIPY